ncbi:unnamed protein product [Linum tenue]|uniref:Uncharacterized protein n=1 Tax=Linum tenue TaxID=586396 RepID=A0AAV0PBA1_9ROSI|nr:unnamed protein product [Linum tenue]
MAGSGSSCGRNISSSRRRLSRRPIPKRGQVKVAIVTGLAHSLASIFSFGRRVGVGSVAVGSPLS